MSGQYGVTITEQAETPEDLADVLRSIADLLETGFTSGYYPSWQLDVAPEDADDVTRCRWCGEEIGIIHYADGDRWQPTPALGDDLCEIRAELATEDGIYRHEPEVTK